MREISNTILIEATPEMVWDALVNPEKTKVYMFGCAAVCGWNIGDKLDWIGQYEGKDMVFVTGNIVAFYPYEKLVYTAFDPNGTIEDLPENYLTVTYLLHKDGASTLLTVTQGDFETVADGERRYHESYNNGLGWQPILDEIKILVEAKS